MSEETVCRVLQDLKVLAAIQERQRIYRDDSGRLNIDNGGYISSIYRLINRENRHKNISDIVNIISDAFAIAENACRKIEYKQPHVDNREFKLHQLKNYSLICKIRQSVEESEIGLKNLRSTYIDDTSLLARIDVVRDLKLQSLKELDTSIQHLKNVLDK